MSGKCPSCDHNREVCICEVKQMDSNEEQKMIELDEFEEEEAVNTSCPVCRQDLEECICIDIASSVSEAAQKLLKNVPPVDEFPTHEHMIVEQLELLNENFNKLLFALECIHQSLDNR